MYAVKESPKYIAKSSDIYDKHNFLLPQFGFKSSDSEMVANCVPPNLAINTWQQLWKVDKNTHGLKTTQ